MAGAVYTRGSCGNDGGEQTGEGRRRRLVERGKGGGGCCYLEMEAEVREREGGRDKERGESNEVFTRGFFEIKRNSEM